MRDRYGWPGHVPAIRFFKTIRAVAGEAGDRLEWRVAPQGRGVGASVATDMLPLYRSRRERASQFATPGI
jgi:hypothetical protein